MTGTGGTDTGTITINVLPVNDVPTIDNLAYFNDTPEDTPLDVIFDIADKDNDSLVLSWASSNPALIADEDISIVNNSGQITMTLSPLAEMYGSTIIQLTLDDGTIAVNQSFQVIVTPVNDLPTAVDDTYQIDEDQAIPLDVLANDYDTEDATLTIVEISDCLNGGTVTTNNGQILYTPVENYYGPDSFEYTLSDSNNGLATATVTLDIISVNDYPEAADDQASTNEDNSVNINVLANDNDNDNDSLTITDATDGTFGTTNIEANGTITYTPNADAYGTDSFTYTITDSQPGTIPATATVEVTVLPINDDPIAVKNEANSGDWEFDEDTVGTFLIDVSDVETAATELIVVLESSDPTLVKSTSIVYSGNGGIKTVQMTPEANRSGTFDLEVTLSDGEASQTYYYPITINPVNDRPTINVTDIITAEDTDGIETATGSDVETLTASLVYRIATQPSHGTVEINSGGVNGQYTYTPAPDYSGEDSFVIEIDDGDGYANSTNQATVNVTVNSANDLPTANNDTAFTNEDIAVTINVLANDDDPDIALEEDYLQIVSWDDVDNGTVTLDDNGNADPMDDQLIFTPDANWNGQEVFTYTVRDQENEQATATVTVTVNAIDDLPANASGDDTVSLNEDAPALDIYVLNNDDVDIDSSLNVDPSAESLSIISITENLDDLDLVISNDSQYITYDSADNYFGTTSFKYQMQDLAGNTAEFTVNITVNSVNDIPTITAIADDSINEDGVAGPYAFYVYDIEDDDDSLSVSASSNQDWLVTDANAVVDNPVAGNPEDRTVTATTEADKNGIVTITVTVRDSNNATASETFVLTVDPVNDTPVAQPDGPIDTDENTTIIIDVAANDDIDLANEGDTIYISDISDADAISYGTFEVYNDGGNDKIRFIPDANWDKDVGQTYDEVLDYTVYDQSQVEQDPKTTSSSQLTIRISPVNDAPTITIDDSADVVTYEIATPTNTSTRNIIDDTLNILEDYGTGVIPFSVIDEEDDDNDDQLLTITATSSNQALVPNENIIITNPTSGNPEDREMSITPLANQNGQTTIEIVVEDSSGATHSDTLLLVYEPVNDAPSEGNDTFTVIEDTVTELDVLANDDIDQNTNPEIEEKYLVSIVSAPSHGTIDPIVGSMGEKLTYRPDANNNLQDSFVYRMEDKNGLQADFTVVVNMTPVNDPPTITPLTQAIIDDTEIVVGETQPTGILEFEVTDVDNEDLTLTVTGVSSRQKLLPNNNISISNDGDGDSDDTDRQVVLTPNGKWNGISIVTLTVHDNHPTDPLTGTTTFNFVVVAVNDTPQAVDDTDLSMNEDGGATEFDILSNDIDEDIQTNDDVLAIQSTTFDNETMPGTLVLVDETADGVDNPTKIEYTPDANWNGSIDFNYTVEDLAGATDVGQITIMVNKVNDDPVAADFLSESTNEDTPLLIDVLPSATDIDDDDTVNLNTDLPLDPNDVDLSIDSAGFSGVDNGTATVEDNKVKFSPDANWNGEETFTYTVIDASGGSSTADITINVASINDAPIAADDTSLSMNEDETKEFSILANDSDVDIATNGDAISIQSTTFAATGQPGDIGIGR